MNFIGIDPGLSGGIAIINHDDILVMKMPVYKVNKKNEISGYMLYPLFHQIRIDEKHSKEKAIIYIEKARIIRGNSAATAAKTMKGYGKLLGIIESVGLKYHEIEINQWKKKFNISKDKEESIALARELYPKVNLLPTSRCTKYHDGMAEALLLAELARRENG